MNEFDIILVGPVARDEIVVDGKGELVTGGGSWYGAFPLLTLGLRVAVAARMAPADFALAEPLRTAGAQLFLRESFQTTGIRNVYAPAMESRTCTVLGCAGAILPEELPPVKATIWYNAALMRGELPLETSREMARRGSLSIDLQGYLRYRQGDDLPTGPFHGLQELLRLATWLKADVAEAWCATGERDPDRAARALAAAGPREVVVTGEGQVRVAWQGQLHHEPLTSRTQAGRTGRGDTCMCTYLGARLKGLPPPQALRVAAQITSRKVEIPGPWQGPVDLAG